MLQQKSECCLLFQAPAVLLDETSFSDNYQSLIEKTTYHEDDRTFQSILREIQTSIEQAADDPHRLILIQPYIYYLLAYHFRKNVHVGAVCFHSAGIVPALIFAGLMEYSLVREFFDEFLCAYYELAREIGARIDLMQARVENVDHESVSQEIREFNEHKDSMYRQIFLKDVRAQDSSRVCGSRKDLDAFITLLRQKHDGTEVERRQRVGAHHIPFPELKAIVPLKSKGIVLKRSDSIFIDNQGEVLDPEGSKTLNDVLCKMLFQPLNFYAMVQQTNRIAERIAVMHDGNIDVMLDRTGINRAKIVYFDNN